MAAFTIRVSNGLDQDEDRPFGPDLDPNFCKGYQQMTKIAGKEFID